MGCLMIDSFKDCIILIFHLGTPCYLVGQMQNHSLTESITTYI